MVLSPDQLIQLGVAGVVVALLLAFTGLWLGRRVITKGEHDDSSAEKDARLAEMRTDRDSWKALALSAQQELGKLTTGIELAAKVNEKALSQLEALLRR